MAKKVIPNELVPLAYETSKKVYENEITFTEGKKIISSGGKMNPGSAGDYIANFKYILEGVAFARTLNTFSMEYYLESIYNDYGPKTLSKALTALNGHIVYYEGIQESIHGRPVRMHNMRNLYDKYVGRLPKEKVDEVEQDEIALKIKQDSPSKAGLLEELQKVKETDPETIKLKGKAYKRDNVTIAKIKLLYDFKCQICGKTIIKRDGTLYVEAAHIVPKHLKGCETLTNIILLCPNHHKEFDLGNSEIINHTKTAVDVILNGTNYHIKFGLLNED